MIKVKDTNGAIVKGLYRGSNGTLLVNDPIGLKQYNDLLTAKKKDEETIKNLQTQVSELAELVKKLLEK